MAPSRSRDALRSRDASAKSLRMISIDSGVERQSLMHRTESRWRALVITNASPLPNEWPPEHIPTPSAVAGINAIFSRVTIHLPSIAGLDFRAIPSFNVGWILG